MIILDTNVVSEIIKPQPAPPVLQWLAAYPPERLFITAVTQAEILYGLELLAVGKRRTALQVVVNTILDNDFAGRILPFDEDAARAYAVIVAARRSMGRPIAPFDGQIAAIARMRAAPVATRNIRDFEGCGITVLNPWSAGRVH